MKKNSMGIKIAKAFIGLLFYGLVFFLSGPVKTYAERQSIFYYQFLDSSFFGPALSGDGDSQSITEFLEALSSGDSMIVSDYYDQYFALSNGEQLGNTILAKDAIIGSPAHNLGFVGVGNKCAGLECPPENMQLSAFHFQKKGKNVYIYFLLRYNKNYAEKLYLNINRNTGTLELSKSSKTEWIVWSEGFESRKYCFLDNKSRDYYLAITEDGLGLVENGHESNGGYLTIHTYDSSRVYNYVRYHTDDKIQYAVDDGSARRSTDLNGTDVIGWSTDSVIKSLSPYSSVPAERAINYISYIPYENPYQPAYNYTSYDLYPVYAGKLHFTIVDEEGNTSTQYIRNRYCPPNGIGNIADDFTDGLVMAEHCWAAFTAPNSNQAGGKIITFADAMFCTDDTYSAKDTSIDESQFELSYLDGKTTLVVKEIPVNREVYLKIVLKEDAADVWYNGVSHAYVGSADDVEKPVQSSFVSYGTSNIKLISEPPIIIPDMENPDTATYDYQTYWYMNIAGTASFLGSSNSYESLTVKLPDVWDVTEADVWAILRRTNVDTGKFAEIESENHLTVTIKPFRPAVRDIDNESFVRFDNIFVSSPRDSLCFVSFDGGEPQQLSSSSSYTPDIQPNPPITISFSNLYGFNYKVTKNGTYTFIVRDSLSTNGAYKSCSITYDNIISEDDISIRISDVFTGICSSDNILIDTGTGLMNSIYMGLLINDCYVKHDDTGWVSVGAPVKSFIYDNPESGAIYSFADGSNVGYLYKVTENGSYQFKFVTSSGNELISETFTYTGITSSHDVSFEMNGHGYPIDSQNVLFGNKAVLPEEPFEEGWEFEGWFSDSALSELFDFDTVISEDTVIYAKWTLNSMTPQDPVTYNIIFGAGSEWKKGTSSGSVFISDADFAKLSGVKTDNITIDESEYTASEGSTKVVLNASFLEELSVGVHSITIVSIDGSAFTTFTVLENDPTYVVSFEMNGHGEPIDSQNVISGNKAVVPSEPSQEGWIFDGWFTNVSLSVPFDFNTVISSDTVIYAKWRKNSSQREISKQVYVSVDFGVIFKMNGHGEQVPEQIVKNGSKATKPENPSEEGWTFDGWYTDEYFTKEYNFTASICMQTYIYAKWTKNKAVTEADEISKADSNHDPEKDSALQNDPVPEKVDETVVKKIVSVADLRKKRKILVFSGKDIFYAQYINNFVTGSLSIYTRYQSWFYPWCIE